MIAKVIVGSLGGFWKLKNKAQSARGITKKLYLGVYKFYLYENAADIALSSHFANTPCMPHGERGVFIAGKARVGKDAVIFQQVTIGSISLPDAHGLGAPTIGDNCYIGAGAKIVGAVTVGNNVRIGANTVVYDDVPDNAVVVSGKQRTIIKDVPLINRYYTYHDGLKEWHYYHDGAWVVETDTTTIAKLEANI